MTRVLSALALLPLVVGVIWFLPAIWTLALAELVLVLALLEYAGLTSRIGAVAPRPAILAAGVVICALVALRPTLVPVGLMLATLAIAAAQLGRASVGSGVGSVAVSVAIAVLALVYLAIPLGALVALREEVGPEVVLLFLLTVMGSDTAQYYGGRALGRRRLAPTLSPKKTVEGALVGLVAAGLAMLVVGQWWLGNLGPAARFVLGLAVGASGIVGDLFESSLKRAADVKDASTLIPGHGGVLDRIDGVVFAVPVFYCAMQLVRSSP